MPKKPPHPCNHPNCNRLVDTTYCADHDREYRLNARERGYDTQWTKFSQWYKRKNPICVKCGRVAYIVHHIVPLPRGQKYDLDNLQSLCRPCHDLVHTRKQ